MSAFICTMASPGAVNHEFAVTWVRDDTVACVFDRTSASTILDLPPGPTDNEDKPCDFAEEELPHWSFDLFLLAAQGEDTAKLHGLAALSARLLLTPSAEGSKSPPPLQNRNMRTSVSGHPGDGGVSSDLLCQVPLYSTLAALITPLIGSRFPLP